MRKRRVVIVGGGFTGLSAAYDLTSAGAAVTLLEADRELGGLAGCFDTPWGPLEKFYHHWYLSDTAILKLIEEIGLGGSLTYTPSRTGLYFANTIFRLASPMDLLRFSPLSLPDRIRLGLMALRVRRVRDWKPLESIGVREWVVAMAGESVYRVVWEPLLRGKFGKYADELAAVWLWNKLKLRGSSRGKRGTENLVYVRGGFGAVIQRLSAILSERGATICCGMPAVRIICENGRAAGVATTSGFFPADDVLVTTAIPPFLELCPDLPRDFAERVRGIRYLANVCLVLALSQSLSDTYWLNVNDPRFPFVGIIEHTNFVSPDDYGGTRLAYLSKYLDADDPVFGMNENQMLEYALPHIRRMFPDFSEAWLVGHFVWKARYAQPIVTPGYVSRIPALRTPIPGLWLCSMAQIYPEDRGTNYAVEYGRRAAREMLVEAAADPRRQSSQPRTIEHS